MSIIFVLLVLFLSLHSCNARIFKVALNDHVKEFQHSITNSKENVDEKVGREVWRQVERKKEEKRVKGDDSEIEGSKRKWKVPERKRGGEEAAGFNLDYLPPKTHPPVHN